MRTIKSLLGALAASALSVNGVLAQSSPNLITGQVPTAAQWNSYFTAKQDTLGFTPVNRAGDSMLGKLTTLAPSTSAAGFNIQQGATPAAPVNGDLWITSAGFFARVNGATVGPVLGGTITLTGNVTGSGTGAIATTLASIPNNLATNAMLAQVGAATLKGNPTASTANVQDFTIHGLTNLATPSQTLDFIPIYDHLTGTIKNVTPQAIVLASTAGVTSLNGLTGVLNVTAGFGMTVTPASPNIAVAVNQAMTPHWTNPHDFQGGAYFGGAPWFDIRSTAHGCAAATLNGSTDDTVAIQCHVNFIHNAFASGGMVYIPPSTNCALVSGGGVNVYAGVWLIGSGPGSSIGGGGSCLNVNTDSIVANFSYDSTTGGTCPSGGHYGGAEKISFLGYANPAATQAAVVVGVNCNVTIRDSKLMFGTFGLQTAGVDSTFDNDFICGYQGCVNSTGANWYVRAKLDSVVTAVGGSSAAFVQGVYSGPGGATAIAENHFVETDFSGNYVYSVYIDDGNNQSAITHINGGVFSGAVFLNHMRYTIIEGTEIGSTSFTVNAGTLLMTASPAFGTTTINGSGGKFCAANSGFTNC